MDNNILKQLREEKALTQEVVAAEMDVSPNTIQNWERGAKIPKESLHKLLDYYGVDQLTRNRVVLAVFGDDRTLEKTSSPDNFPYFLFEERPDISAAAKNAVLTAEEMELFGYTYFMIGDADEYSYDAHYCPYDYHFFKDHGGYFKTMKMLADIEGKIGCYITSSRTINLAAIVYDYGLASAGLPFSFCKLSKQDIINGINHLPNTKGSPVSINLLYSKCKAVENDVCIGTDTESYVDSYYQTDSDGIKSFAKCESRWSSKMKYTICLNAIEAKCIVLEKIESQDPKYLEKKKQYLSDRDAYDKHPNLYEREPSFTYQFRYILQLTETGRSYIDWYETD